MWNAQHRPQLQLKVRYKKQKTQKKTKTFVGSFVSVPTVLDSVRVATDVYINTINYARKTLYISTPYFVCSPEIRNALFRAAARGVEIYLILPGVNDKKLVGDAARSQYAELLARKIKVFEYTIGFNHSKLVLADEELCICGTINFDYRSFDLDFENAIITNCKSFCASVRADFRSILKESREVEPSDCRQKRLKSLLILPIRKQL